MSKKAKTDPCRNSEKGNDPKIQHRSREGAETHALHLLASKGMVREVYECPRCGYFHIGRRPDPMGPLRLERQARDRTTMYHELGSRAYRNLTAENIPTRTRRAKTLRKRARRRVSIAPSRESAPVGLSAS